MVYFSAAAVLEDLTMRFQQLLNSQQQFLLAFAAASPSVTRQPVNIESEAKGPAPTACASHQSEAVEKAPTGAIKSLPP